MFWGVNSRTSIYGLWSIANKLSCLLSMDTPVLVFPNYIKSHKCVSNAAYNTYVCTRCNMWFSEERWAYGNLCSHLYSKGHMERMELHKANRCNTCELQFPTASKMAAHVATNIHQMKELGVYRVNVHCAICDMTFVGHKRFTEHIDTRRHKMKEAGTYATNVRCETCELTFPCPAHYERHVATKAHARKLLPPPQRSCEICNFKATTDNQMAIHLATNKHRRNAENGIKNTEPEVATE